MSSIDSSSGVAFIDDHRPIKTNQATPKIKSTVTGGNDGGGGGNGMENRLARLESDIDNIKDNVRDIRSGNRWIIGLVITCFATAVGITSFQFDRVGGKFDRVEDKFDRFDGRLDRIEVSMGKVEVKLDNVETILVDIRDSLNKDPK